ncbi:hypothetical protein [Fulvivirga ligni]|uniref:hypothetical protein n=1 Tax=Fulvivirga ligni TaxID=2904246 RepID=UPI001F4174D1|nr:hypothetical protein [Fulvivirga ligni]UII20561.1 hypothetical protein LVD16_22225 [Fulvivirga ligni]
MNKCTLIIVLGFVVSCTNKQAEKLAVQSEQIENFSNINYQDAPEQSYFYEITQLPNGFSLGDFNDHNSILYLTESANIFPFDDNNLKYFLTNQEFDTVFETYIDSSFIEPVTRRVQYFPYERLVTENYVLLIINKRRNDSNGRDYQFDLRTFTFDGKLISNLTLARWDDDDDIYFSGWLMPDMTIKRTYSDEKTEYFMIEDSGQIMKKDANKTYE